MNKLFLLALIVSSSGAFAQPVILEPIINASCGLQTYKLRRLSYNPDGTFTGSTTEFDIPLGYNLEITDVEVEHPVPYANTSHLYAVYVQNKASGSQWTMWERDYFTTKLMSGTGPLSPGVQTGFVSQVVREHRNFATPFVASSAARLCARMPAWGPNFIGRLRITGRLVATSAKSDSSSTIGGTLF